MSAEHDEEHVTLVAGDLATAEENLATEYLRLIATGVPTWQAQKQAELQHLRAVTLARAELEIAVEQLRRRR